jgi:DNA-binding NarL/FixJ family response regulator
MSVNRKRILFVDDEAPVLDGLRNLLRKRREWELAFALGGEAALAELERAPFDVIVSDMRMPGMDGAALLERVKREYPSVVRIVLSGYADRQPLLRVIPVAHQLLSKPCDPHVLASVIERTCMLESLLSDSVLRRVVGEMGTLPSVPSTYLELTDVIGRDDVSPSRLAAIVEKTPRCRPRFCNWSIRPISASPIKSAPSRRRSCISAWSC